MSSASIWGLISDFYEVSIFQYMAWYAIFRLLWSSDPVRMARRRDILVITALCLLVFFPTGRMVWVAAVGIAVYLLICGGSDLHMRAAGIVLAALSVQEFWGHIVFQLFAPPLLHAETAVVGTMLQLTRAGTIWHDNVITTPSGYGILLYPYCSSFHNVSLALLCWITVTMLKDVNWRASDYVASALVVTTVILLNTARLYLMALDLNSYHYWHDGMGFNIFETGVSLSVLLLTLYGSRPFMSRT